MTVTKPEIIYEDDAIIVCRKPAGMATQTKRIGQQDMESLLKNYRAGNGETPYVGVVHRLDQPVEGLVVFAKTPSAAAGLSKQMAKRDISKHYYAAALLPASGERVARLEDYLLADKAHNLTRVVGKDVHGAQRAALSYRVLAEQPKEDGQKAPALYDILLETGRHHQIRVQFANMGSPLWGDVKYGAGIAGQLALCAYRLEFEHPESGRRMDFSVQPEHPLLLQLLESVQKQR